MAGTFFASKALLLDLSVSLSRGGNYIYQRAPCAAYMGPFFEGQIYMGGQKIGYIYMGGLFLWEQIFFAYFIANFAKNRPKNHQF